MSCTDMRTTSVLGHMLLQVHVETSVQRRGPAEKLTVHVQKHLHRYKYRDRHLQTQTWDTGGRTACPGWIKLHRTSQSAA
jgi:hypothetical protein